VVPDLVTAVAVDTVKLGLRELGVTSISVALRGRGNERVEPGCLKSVNNAKVGL